jgi:magnesium transporter
MATIEICYDGSGSYRKATFEELPEILTADKAFVWIDADGNDAAELEPLRAQFGLHRLAVESALEGQQRAKIMLYDDMIYVEFYGLRLVDDAVRTDDLGIFVGEKFVITVRRSRFPEVEHVLTRWREEQHEDGRSVPGHPRIPGIAPQRRKEPSSSMILYAILDDLVDGYFPVIDWYGEKIENFEDRVIDRPNHQLQLEIQKQRSEMLQLRRMIAPEQEVLNTLLRRDVPVIDEAILPYFADVHDHVLRIHDWMESYRDQLVSIVDLQLSMQSNGLNQTMRTLTASSIILMVCSLISGIYGMNFRHFPTMDWRYGLLFSLGLMAASTVALVGVFRAKGWW